MKVVIFLLLGVLMFAQKGAYVAVFPWEKEQLEWAKKFRIVEIGSFEDITTLDISSYELPIVYEWLAGFYEKSATPFDRWAMEHGLLLNEQSPKIESDDDHYYDMCNQKLLKKRVEYLVSQVKKSGAKGIFFDWGNEEFLHDQAFFSLKKRFQKRYPGKHYQECIADFFDQLRSNGLTVVANQAYRNPMLLDHIDYDVSESLISTIDTLPKNSLIDREDVKELPATNYYPVDGTIKGTFENLRHIYDLLQKYSAKAIFHINYAAPRLHPTRSGYKSAPPKEVIHHNFAFAKLFDSWSYTEVPFDTKLEKDPIYFVDIGRPTGDIKTFDGGYMRAFEKGFVVVCDRDLVLRLPQKIYDTYTGKWVEAGKYKIEQSYDTITKSYIPIGRIFLYDKAFH